ncbi:MAG TPA: penicillin-binding protein activator [Oligoflexia bacterium]|nr:penicillin-binding protein activator [Oligoflexia bacterium]
MMMFSNLTAAFLILACLLVLPHPAQAAPQDGSELRVGVIVALTGDGAAIGTAVKNGMELAYSELPAEKRKSIRLFYEDDAMNAVRTLAAYRKLRALEKIDVVVTMSSQTSKVLASIADKEQVPQAAIASDPEISAGKKWVVNFWVTPKEEAKALVPEALRRRYRRIACIASVHPFSQSVKDAFRQENKQLAITLDEDYLPEIRDFRPFMAKLKAQKDLDAVLVLLMSGQVGVFARQVRQSGIELPLFGFELFEDPNEVKAADGALTGAWYVMAGDASSAFNEKFQQHYPDSSLFGAANGYDLIFLLSAAREHGTSAESVNFFLHNVKDFHGVLGTFSATGENSFTLPAMLKVVTHDGFAPLIEGTRD